MFAEATLICFSFSSSLRFRAAHCVIGSIDVQGEGRLSMIKQSRAEQGVRDLSRMYGLAYLLATCLLATRSSLSGTRTSRLWRRYG